MDKWVGEKEEYGNTKLVERLRAAGDNFTSDQLFESYNEDEEDRDTNFVLAALTESRESLKMLVGVHYILKYYDNII